MDKVGATDNFFELGGTSLVVTRVIIEADKAGLHVAYGDVFANPTPRKLAQLINGSESGDEGNAVTDFDYTAIDNLLQRNTLDNFRKGERQPLGNVLYSYPVSAHQTRLRCLCKGRGDGLPRVQYYLSCAGEGQRESKA